MWQHTAQGSSFLGWALQLEKKKLGWLGEAPPPQQMEETNYAQKQNGKVVQGIFGRLLGQKTNREARSKHFEQFRWPNYILCLAGREINSD